MRSDWMERNKHIVKLRKEISAERKRQEKIKSPVVDWDLEREMAWQRARGTDLWGSTEETEEYDRKKDVVRDKDGNPVAAKIIASGQGKWLPPRKGHNGYYELLDEMETLHAEKSSGYGTGKDPFANFTAVAAANDEERFMYPVERAIEKLARAMSLYKQGRFRELGEEFKDVASLMLCAEAMRREDASDA